MRTRAPQTALGWAIYVGALGAVTVLVATMAPGLFERTKTSLFVMWFFTAVFLIVWRLDRRSRAQGKAPYRVEVDLAAPVSEQVKPGRRLRLVLDGVEWDAEVISVGRGPSPEHSVRVVLHAKRLDVNAAHPQRGAEFELRDGVENIAGGTVWSCSPP